MQEDLRLGDLFPPRREQIDREALAAELMAFGVDGADARAIAGCVVFADGVLLYGSWARGQAREASDVDLLILNGVVVKLASIAPKVSMSVYTTAQLVEADQTLFGMHLARDGKILLDTDGGLRALLDAIRPPDPATLLVRIRHLCSVLDVSDHDLRQHISGLCKVARYLLRSAIYATALSSGHPTFSLDDLADVMSDPALPVVLSSHEAVHPGASSEVFMDLKARLSRLLGDLPSNTFGSLDALVVEEWEHGQDLAALALLAISDDEELPYQDIPKVVL